MADANRKIITQPEKVEAYLQGCCEYFGMKRSELSKNQYSSSTYTVRKRFIIGVLCKYTILTQREIALLLGYKTHPSIHFHLKKLEEELSDEAYGYDKTKWIWQELLTYLKINSYEDKD